MRGWPATLYESRLLDEPVALRPVRVRDARIWREIRVRNAPWLRPWEPTNPETPLYRSSLSPYVSMVRAMRREARIGQALPWVVTYGDEFAGQLTVGSIVWGSARSGQVGYWIDEKFAGRGIIPTALAMAVDHSFRGGRAAPAGSQHPAGEPRQPTGGGEARFPGRGTAAPPAAHRRRVA
jgi:ribosomal-protein-alanine N-acetyltransferase